jgi:hypothetical protein
LPPTSLLFQIVTTDAAQVIFEVPVKKNLYTYTQMMHGPRTQVQMELQEAFDDLHNCSQENDFTVIKTVTVSIVLRKGGKLTEPTLSAVMVRI